MFKSFSTPIKVNAIATIFKAYGWMDISLIYEDTDYVNGLISYLTDALQETETLVSMRSVILLQSKDSYISMVLQKLKDSHRKIFLMHMAATLGFRLFVLTNKARMMSEYYVWIVMQGLSNLLICKLSTQYKEF